MSVTPTIFITYILSYAAFQIVRNIGGSAKGYEASYKLWPEEVSRPTGGSEGTLFANVLFEAGHKLVVDESFDVAREHGNIV